MLTFIFIWINISSAYLNKKKGFDSVLIHGYQKLTLLDFPNHLASIIFLQGCNCKCPYCHNSELIPLESNDVISYEEVMENLNKRKNVLEGVVVTGGEPLINSDIKKLLIDIRKLNLKIKIDTNGGNPKLLQEIIDEGLVDYIAMDIKNVPEKYPETCGCNPNFVDNIMQCIVLIKNGGIAHEFRTTITKKHHTIEDIENILKLVGDSDYFVQNFRMSDFVIDKGLKGFTNEELESFLAKLGSKYPNFHVRDLGK